MIKPIFLVGLILISMASFGQFSLSGKVVDSESHEPLLGASVFAQNTTRGTITDKDGVFHLYLDKGGYELIISYTGYTSKTITVQGGENREINVELQKADNSMSEIVIRSSNEVPDGWLKYGHFFVEHFIGATPNADSC